jgi:Cu+-exporting ATPase
LISFVSWGRYLENCAKAKTTSSLSKLLTLAPAHATLLQAGIENEIIEKRIPTSLIQEKDLIKIKPGEKIPTDGEIEFGSTTVDEAIITGEALPITKTAGHIVIGGSMNLTGVIHVRAKRVGADTTLSQIIKLVSDAQTTKAPIQDLADLVAGYFVPGILWLSALTFIIWTLVTYYLHWIPNQFPAESNYIFVSLSFAISVIIVACPCALGLATPTGISFCDSCI